jgi:hypothetical protein
MQSSSQKLENDSEISEQISDQWIFSSFLAATALNVWCVVEGYQYRCGEDSSGDHAGHGFQDSLDPEKSVLHNRNCEGAFGDPG